MRDLLNMEITEVDLDKNPITEKDYFDEKIGIMDVRAIVNGNVDCDIEMQVVNTGDIADRMTFYLSRQYAGNLMKGDKFKNSKKCIAILIADFKLEKLKDADKVLTKWNFREEKYNNIVLTDKLEIYILELPKYKMRAGSENMDLWINFIRNLEVLEMSGKIDKSLMETVEAIEEAQRKLDELNENEEARYIAHLRDKYVRDAESLKSFGYSEGEKAGIEKGVKQGVEQGAKLEKIKIAKKLKEKVSIEEVMEITGLTKEEIETL